MEERHRIARELHDSVTQKLFSLRLTADAAAALLADADPAAAAAQLDDRPRAGAEATDELRAVVVGLRPADLAGDGLDAALRKQAELLDRAHAATVRVPRRAGARGWRRPGGGALPGRPGGPAQRAAPRRAGHGRR